MGTFVELRKKWEEAKKKAPDQALAKKTFSKGMGPVLTELDGVAKDLSAARHKPNFNPEKIVVLSPRVVKLCTTGKAIASEYGAFANKQKWTSVASAASAVESTLTNHAATEAKEWRPTKEYIDLWKRVVLEMALSAAGLEDSTTAEDLRRILEKKTKDINAARGDVKAIKDEIDRFNNFLPKGDVEYRGDDVAKAVAYALKNPGKEGDKSADEARQSLKRLVERRNELDGRLKELKALVKKPEVQNSSSKAAGQQAVVKGEDFLKQFTAAALKGATAVAKLPKAA